VKRTRTETVEITGDVNSLSDWVLGYSRNGNRGFFR